MKNFSVLSVVVIASLVGCAAENNAADDEQLSSESFALSAPSLSWTCKAGYVFEVVTFKLELLGFDTADNIVRLAPQTNNISTAPIMVDCNGSGGFTGGAVLSWVGPKVKVSTGVYELRVTPQDFPVFGSPGPFDVADPASAFCSVPGGLAMPGNSSISLSACGTSAFTLIFNVKATL